MYVRNIEFIKEWDGKVVKIMLSPLEFEDALTLEDIEVPIPKDDSKEAKNEAAGKFGVEFAKRVRPLLPKYIVSFDGPVDSQGVAVSIDEMLKVVYFVPLVIAIGKQLMDASHPPQKPAEPSGS